MKMQSSKLIRSLLTQNIALCRENQRIYAFLGELARNLAMIEKDGRETGIIDGIGTIRKDIRMVLEAVADRREIETGRRHLPTAEELGSLAVADQQVDSVHFITFDPKHFGAILDSIFSDMKEIMDKDREKGKDHPTNPPPKSDWKVNLGGDLEGEWEDYRDDDPDFPSNPFAGAD